jgi:hypothetical protein
VLNIKVTGLKVIQNKIDRASKDISTKISDEVFHQAGLIQMRSLSSAPINQGIIKSWSKENDFVKIRNSQYKKILTPAPNLKIEIGFRAKHAPFQEFGTGTKFALNGEYSEFAEFANKNFYTRRKPALSVAPRRYFLHHYIIARRALSRKTSTIMKNLFK